MKKFGYLGLVRSSDFINGEQLAQAIGLVEGRPQYTDCDWLHFVLDGQEILVPTKTFRYCVSWRDIYERGAVYSDTEGYGPYPGGSGVNQNCYVTIAGTQYKVTLLKGSNEDNHTHVVGISYNTHPSFYDPKSTWNSEWSQLMYRVHDGVHNPTHSNPTNASHPYGVWEQLSDIQLQLDWLRNGWGTSSWCQEKGSWSEDSQDYRVFRGARGVSYVACGHVADFNPYLGWRPTLRKV